MYITVGDPILILGPTYDNFRLTSQSQGAVINYYDYDSDFNLNENGFVASIKDLNPSLVYICNPNNPSGNLVSCVFLKYLITTFPEVIFLVDEAYFEFSNNSIAHEVVNFPNLFVSRTFSKAFALANFRAGYLISDVNNIQQISKIRNPKNFTTFAQEAVIGVLSDLEYMHSFVSEVNSAKKWFVGELEKLNFIDKVFESHANFVLVRFVDFEVKMKIFNQLSENNIFVRNLLHSEKLINCLRISIGTKLQMERVLKTLK
jgi:histidinol-phosphate aminotransferase